MPSTFALHPNFPNPFNPSTSIRFDLPNREQVSLRVFDLSGRLVRVLVPGVPMNSGTHSVKWDGRDSAAKLVSAGVYLVRLEAGSFGKTHRMTLLK